MPTSYVYQLVIDLHARQMNGQLDHKNSQEIIILTVHCYFYTISLQRGRKSQSSESGDY